MDGIGKLKGAHQGDEGGARANHDLPMPHAAHRDGKPSDAGTSSRPKQKTGPAIGGSIDSIQVCSVCVSWSYPWMVIAPPQISDPWWWGEEKAAATETDRVGRRRPIACMRECLSRRLS